MDIHRNLAIRIYSFIILWTSTLCNTDIPTRTSTDFISRADQRLNLTIDGVCANFSGTKGIKFQRMIIYEDNLYIGATNRILQIGVSKFSLDHVASLGPSQDSPDCVGPSFCEKANCGELKCTDNENRLLLPHRNQLIVCGSIYHGTCDLLTLKNVAEPYTPVPDRQTLKCEDGNSQIAKCGIVASVYTNENDSAKDLLYLGNKCENSQPSIDTLFPPETGGDLKNIGFQKIVKSSFYLQTNDGRNFIATWSTATHNFMLSASSEQNQTILTRLCHSTMNELPRKRLSDDDEYGQTSYTETVVTCGSYKKAIQAFYTSERLYMLMLSPEKRIALCSVSIEIIKNHFDNARRSCLAGMDTEAKFSDSNMPCTLVSNVSESWITCGLSQEMTTYLKPIICKRALHLQQDFLWPSTVEPPTTFAVDFFDDAAIAFFGTNGGYVYKAKVGNSTTKFAERIELDLDLPVLKDVAFDKSSQHIYAMSPNKVFKIKLSNCEQYETCGKCVGSGDPYCGWCVLQSRCTHKSQCEDSDSAQHWMKTTRDSSECPQVSGISPGSLSVAVTQELSLTFGGSPLPASTTFDCNFVVDDASIHSSTLQNFPSSPTCLSPSNPPNIPIGQDHVNVTLQITTNGAVVAAGDFIIYKCSNMPGVYKSTMCGSCVTSSWMCKWCLNSYTCEDSCARSVGISNSDECPVVVEVVNKEVDVAVGKPHQFTLITKNLPMNDFECVLNACDSASKVTVHASRNGDNLTCSLGENELNCPKKESNIVLSLKSGSYFVDTPRPSAVTVGSFNCSGDQAECGLCVITHTRHPECSWCSSDQMCRPREDCSDGGITSIAYCPVPTINSIKPNNGPTNGGTEITIRGNNLGSRYEEISYVVIRNNEDVNCTILPKKYVPSKTIVCKTTSTTGTSYVGKVYIKMSYHHDKVATKEKSDFEFKKVFISGYSPKYALPGTKVIIQGSNLDVGNGASVMISKERNMNSSYRCKRTSNRLECALPEASDTGLYSIWANLDGFSEEMEGKIDYVEQPNVTMLVGRRKLVGFYKGGILATFKLTSLRGIQTAVLDVNDGKARQDCTLDQNKTSIICPIPAMDSPDAEQNGRSKRAVSTEDDNQVDSRATESTDVSAKIVINDEFAIPLTGSLNLSYVNNPIINPLSSLPCRSSDALTAGSSQDGASTGSNSTVIEKTSEDETETITVQLTGKYLNSAAVKEDYSVVIDLLEGASKSVTCVPTFLDMESLICKAPAAELRHFEGEKIKVTVEVGEFNDLLRTDCSGGSAPISAPVIAVPVAVILVLLIIIICLVIVHKQRAIKQREDRKQIMFMLDTLENKTRETARKAYFELQLGYMTTLTDNISDSITYIPPVSCFMRALFNDCKGDHPMIASKKGDGISKIRASGLDDFALLLKNKDFLITLVKTLEEQKNFTVKEKGHFASLLTVCLFDDLVYFTKIMMEILSELIQKHVGKNPKLLLRRSESVVEKMVSHWLCINLYSQCIRDQAGKPLFLLTKAIHFLVGSAPCDVVANKALNSLNEMTLLGTEMEYVVVTLQASVVEKGQQSEIFEVKVVNCDTITQVKEKIIEVVYRDRPYSECPKHDDMELCLVAGQGHIGLSDIDSMSFKEGQYTKINTLKHYNVPDGAEVVLSPIKPGMDGATEAGSPPPEPQKRRLYHLIHPRDKELNGFSEVDDSGNKTKAIIGNLINQPFKEIYLTRMVRSKTTVQEYVDGVFNAILTPNPISRSVKYFFQYLDKEATKHKINDPEVLHIWKNNSLLLRYWVNILKNPEFLFDVNKTAIVDSCLNVITQAFMDACTTTNHKLGQDSPSNKLLYAKDAEKYREMVSKFFVNVSNQDAVTEGEMTDLLQEISKKHASGFNKRAAAQELYNHLEKYRSQVLEAMEDDQQIYSKLNEIVGRLSPDTNGHSHETSILV